MKPGASEQGTISITLSQGFLTKPFEVNNLFDLLAEHLQLTWQYKKVTEAGPSSEEISPLAFVSPPADELEKLYDYARRGNVNAIQQWVQQIVVLDEKYHPFAQQIKTAEKGDRLKTIWQASVTLSKKQGMLHLLDKIKRGLDN